MCGIAGIITQKKVSVAQLQQMVTAVAHRGPDGEGYWLNENAQTGLGHKRLSVIDLSANGAQPMHYLNRYSITYNGEIYNYTELKQELRQKGYLFESASDTEVILAAYDCWKENSLSKLDGMFAFALWDEQEQLLFAARDRFGEKPFYYYKDEKQFLFASEMKAFWAAGIPKIKNDTLLLFYLADGQMYNPHNDAETFYEQISSLPAASYLQFNLPSNSLKTERWWDLDKEQSIRISENDAAEKLFFLLSGSVNKRLRSDVEVGTSLSGGLDSSTVLALIHQQRSRPKTFSAIFPGFEKDESEYIREIHKQYPSQNFSITPSASDFSSDLQDFFYHQEQPVQSASAYLQYKIYQLAKQQQIKVLLDGQGADEILGGYVKYLHWYLQSLLAKRKLSLFKKEKNLFRQNYPTLQWNWKNYIAAATPFFTATHLQQQTLRRAGNVPNINPDFAFHAFSKEYVYKPVVHQLNDILYNDTMQNTLPELLRYADRNSMAHGVEVRLPFLSHELVQFIFSLPAALKMHNGFTKWILRKTMETRLPAAICWRKDKTGYEPPQHQWMEQPVIREHIYEARKKLVEEQVLLKSVLDKPVISKAAHESNNYDWRYLSATVLF